MATERIVLSITKEAAADYSAKQYYAMKLSSGKWTLCNTAGEFANGVLVNDPESGENAQVCVMGACKGIAGGTIAENAPITVDANGAFVAVSDEDQSSCGRALEAATVGQVFEMLIGASEGGGGYASKSYGTLTISIPDLSKIADGDVVTALTPGFAGTIESVQVVVTDPVTTASKGTTLNLEVGTTNLTGGVLTLTSANMTPLGKVNAGTAITAGADFAATDTISVEASSTTAFVEGAADIVIVYSNNVI